LETPNPKNHKAQILKHQMSKDEIEKKSQQIMKKIAIKRMMINFLKEEEDRVYNFGLKD
jgi:hypothetical protein